MRKRRVCHITSVHVPEDVRIHIKECQSLEKAGFEVHLIAKRDSKLKDSKVICHSINYETSGRILRFINSPREALKVAIEVDADIYHLHDPELLLISKKLKNRGKIVIFDAHEDLPKQILTKHYIPKYFRRILAFFIGKLERHYLNYIGNLITATKSIKKELEDCVENSQVVNNYPLLSEFKGVGNKSFSERNVFCYIGGINEIRGCTELVQSFEDVNTRCLFAGPIETDYKNELEKQSAWKKIDYLGNVSRKKVSEILNNSIAGFVTFLPVPNHVEAQPNKMFEYMSAGLPVIASNFPLWKEIIEGNDCGICIDPEKPKEIAKAMKYLMDNPDEAKRMGENGRKAVMEKYNWEMESQKLISYYNKLG